MIHCVWWYHYGSLRLRSEPHTTKLIARWRSTRMNSLESAKPKRGNFPRRDDLHNDISLPDRHATFASYVFCVLSLHFWKISTYIYNTHARISFFSFNDISATYINIWSRHKSLGSQVMPTIQRSRMILRWPGIQQVMALDDPRLHTAHLWILPVPRPARTLAATLILPVIFDLPFIFLQPKVILQANVYFFCFVRYEVSVKKKKIYYRVFAKVIFRFTWKYDLL